jgi:hypothetical protein
MTETGRDRTAALNIPRYGDSDAVAASGVPLPSLRVLQAAGAIRAEKQPKHHGGFRRMWPEPEIVKAAAAAAIGEHFAWNIRMVAKTMAKTGGKLWEVMALIAVGDLVEAKTKKTLIMAEETDWLLEFVDRKFLFVRIPEPARTAVAGTGPTRPELLLGVTSAGEGFHPVPWMLGSTSGRRAFRKAAGEEAFRSAAEFYRLSLIAYDNCLSKATVNVSMPGRMAWHRLRGHEPHFLQKALHFKKRRSDG